MSEKIAVVLLNLGGPLKKEDIKPFLFNFFMDKNIISLPYPFRRFLAGYIAKKRSKNEALTSYARLGYKSPLLENTEKQERALEKSLKNQINDKELKVFTSMRYWHPLSFEVIKEVKKYNPDKIVLLPLYPQYSTATTKSSIENWKKESEKQGLKGNIISICCYPFNDGFINSSAEKIKKSYIKAIKDNPDIEYRVLFSAHGLPEKTIKAGDPYQWQCEESARRIAEKTAIKDLDWQICYQSRVGRLKWIEPSTEDALEKAAKDNKAVIIYPHAFVSEHVETLVEIEEEYREEAKKLNIPDFIRVDTVGEDKVFINGLVDTVKFSLDKNNITCGDSVSAVCKKTHKKCAYKLFVKNDVIAMEEAA